MARRSGDARDNLPTNKVVLDLVWWSVSCDAAWAVDLDNLRINARPKIAFRYGANAHFLPPDHSYRI